MDKNKKTKESTGGEQPEEKSFPQIGRAAVVCSAKFGPSPFFLHRNSGTTVTSGRRHTFAEHVDSFITYCEGGPPSPPASDNTDLHTDITKIISKA